MDPNYSLAWNNKGFILYEMGKYEEAIQAYDKAIEIDPNYLLVWNNKGIALEKLGRYDEAAECYNKAKELESNFILTKKSGMFNEKRDTLTGIY